MPNWYWEKKELRATPSQEKGKKKIIFFEDFPCFLTNSRFIFIFFQFGIISGMDFDTETRYRREGVR